MLVSVETVNSSKEISVQKVSEKVILGDINSTVSGKIKRDLCTLYACS